MTLTCEKFLFKTLNNIETPETLHILPILSSKCEVASSKRVSSFVTKSSSNFATSCLACNSRYKVSDYKYKCQNLQWNSKYWIRSASWQIKSLNAWYAVFFTKVFIFHTSNAIPKPSDNVVPSSLLNSSFIMFTYISSKTII